MYHNLIRDSLQEHIIQLEKKASDLETENTKLHTEIKRSGAALVQFVIYENRLITHKLIETKKKDND